MRRRINGYETEEIFINESRESTQKRKLRKGFVPYSVTAKNEANSTNVLHVTCAAVNVQDNCGADVWNFSGQIL